MVAWCKNSVLWHYIKFPSNVKVTRVINLPFSNHELHSWTTKNHIYVSYRECFAPYKSVSAHQSGFASLSTAFGATDPAQPMVAHASLLMQAVNPTHRQSNEGMEGTYQNSPT